MVCILAEMAVPPDLQGLLAYHILHGFGGTCAVLCGATSTLGTCSVCSHTMGSVDLTCVSAGEDSPKCELFLAILHIRNMYQISRWL